MGVRLYKVVVKENKVCEKVSEKVECISYYSRYRNCVSTRSKGEGGRSDIPPL